MVRANQNSRLTYVSVWFLQESNACAQRVGNVPLPTCDRKSNQKSLSRQYTRFKSLFLLQPWTLEEDQEKDGKGGIQTKDRERKENFQK